MKIMHSVFICYLFIINFVVAKDYQLQNGTLSINCNDIDFCDISINGEKIDEEFYTPNQHTLIHSYNKNINGFYLLNLYHGDSCPSMYKIIHIYSTENSYISESFGNCNAVNLNILKDKVTFDFSNDDSPKRKALSYHYSLLKHQLIHTSFNPQKKH